MQLLLLSYSFTAQALSAQTSKVIEGTAPYFTFDNGLNKVTTTNDLLGITLSDGTKITPQTNNSAITPIVLPKTGETLADPWIPYVDKKKIVTRVTLTGPKASSV